MTTLSRLKAMKDPEIQEWLKKVGRENVPLLVQALLGADEEVMNSVLRNLSEKASSYLKDDLKNYQTKYISEETIRASAVKLEKMF
jgi:flagellar motor switch protein FliG